ncbi:hypothetical protein VitviT2T_024654 [Vitis vinifera]|uniref:Retrotransposon gag domain-containing protein n=1 Tax=Vitis vinifera TaxID=29760 RepID=A0ABY9DH20_VITVI|nr:hypothetical protein VitviT2T_024654 [Vitis vinifera]
MGTNNERIEHLETGLGVVQEELQRMELGMIDKLHHLEEALNRLLNVLLANPESSNQGNYHQENQNGSRQIVSSKSAKLEFPRLSGDDPTEGFNRVEQFFDYQGTAENQKVPMAAYHLEGEANQWWQWLYKTLKEERHVISWGKFEEELWALFGPSRCEDFDEALSRIKQLGTLIGHDDLRRAINQIPNKIHGQLFPVTNHRSQHFKPLNAEDKIKT